MSGGAEAAAAAGVGAEAERRVRIVVEYCEPCGFEPTYQELASAVKEEYPDIEIESRLGGTGAFEIEINGQLVFSKLENGGFPYEKDLCPSSGDASRSRRALFPFLPPCRDPRQVLLRYGASLSRRSGSPVGRAGTVPGAPASAWP
ncbi:migration and invasion enhancer 1 isoform 1-T1 [Spheniscus humboldti]